MAGDLVDPLASVRAYLAAEKAPATRRAYQTDFADFAAWCDRAGESSLPASAVAVARYLSALADSRLKVSTITRRVAAIRAAHRSSGYEPPTNAEGVKAVLRGIRRTHKKAPNRKAPATAEVISTMRERMDTDTGFHRLAALRDKALLLFGFAAALRRSELVALDVADLEQHARGLLSSATSEE